MTFLLPTMKRPQPPSLDDPDAVDSSWCPVCSTMDSRRADFPTELMPVEGGGKRMLNARDPLGQLKWTTHPVGVLGAPSGFQRFRDRSCWWTIQPMGLLGAPSSFQRFSFLVKLGWVNIREREKRE